MRRQALAFSACLFSFVPQFRGAFSFFSSSWGGSLGGGAAGLLLVLGCGLSALARLFYRRLALGSVLVAMGGGGSLARFVESTFRRAARVRNVFLQRGPGANGWGRKLQRGGRSIGSQAGPPG